jgi:site-specific recombinase XerD
MSLLSKLADFFESYLPIVKGSSHNTITSYQYAFSLLFEYLWETLKLAPDKVSYSDLTEKVLLGYLQWLETSRGCSAKTRNLRRAAIMSFARYAVRDFSPEISRFCSVVTDIPKKRVPKTDEIRYFTREEIAVLLASPNKSTRIGQRDTTLMTILYASGARAQEICDITVNDISFEHTARLRLTGKGQKSRSVVLPEGATKILKGYLDSRGIDVASTRNRERHVFSSILTTVSCI